MLAVMPQRCAESLMVYHFSGELRKPTIKVASTNKVSAIAWYTRTVGLPDGTIVLPRSETVFEIEKHLNKIEVVEEDQTALEAFPPFFPDTFEKSRTKYGDADPMEFPLLQHFGRGGIQPEWVLNRRTGKVEMAGEFESFPKYFLDLSEKPTVDDLRRVGGRMNIGGGFDKLACLLNASEPWLRLEDGENLRQRLLDEIDRYERRHR